MCERRNRYVSECGFVDRVMLGRPWRVAFVRLLLEAFVFAVCQNCCDSSNSSSLGSVVFFCRDIIVAAVATRSRFATRQAQPCLLRCTPSF